MGHAVVTIKEALAVAPGTQQVRLIALRHTGDDAYGRPRLDCLLAGRWTRRAFQGVAWATAEAVRVAEDTAAEFMVKLRARKELQPLDLNTQPGIELLLKVVDVEELMA